MINLPFSLPRYVCIYMTKLGDNFRRLYGQRQGKSNQRAKWRARMCWWLPAVCLPMHARGSRWVAGQWLATAVRTTQVTRVMPALPLIPREVLEHARNCVKPYLCREEKPYLTRYRIDQLLLVAYIWCQHGISLSVVWIMKQSVRTSLHICQVFFDS